jgi:hypothetical protein
MAHRPKSIEQRIERLEAELVGASDLELMEWGERVTDDELRAVIDMTDAQITALVGHDSEATAAMRRIDTARTTGRPLKSQAEFWRAVLPIIERMRQRE